MILDKINFNIRMFFNTRVQPNNTEKIEDKTGDLELEIGNSLYINKNKIFTQILRKKIKSLNFSLLGRLKNIALKSKVTTIITRNQAIMLYKAKANKT